MGDDDDAEMGDDDWDGVGVDGRGEKFFARTVSVVSVVSVVSAGAVVGGGSTFHKMPWM